MTTYEQEAEQRWGHTTAFRESRRRAASYDDDDWARLKDEAGAIEARLAELMAAGEPAAGPAATAAAEAHRAHLSTWFYDCSTDLHRSLADLYVEDERFAAHYDGIAPGLAHYVRAAIHANADQRS